MKPKTPIPNSITDNNKVNMVQTVCEKHEFVLIEYSDNFNTYSYEQCRLCGVIKEDAPVPESLPKKKKVLQSESIPEFDESIENMSQESKDRVDNFLKESESLPDVEEAAKEYAMNISCMKKGDIWGVPELRIYNAVKFGASWQKSQQWQSEEQLKKEIHYLQLQIQDLQEQINNRPGE